MTFEFDPAKSAANALKHGIDLVEAQQIFEDVNRLEVPARTSGEPRVATIGIRKDQIWVVIWTPRGESIRIISARRAREGERRLYEGEKR